jgi:hypothetical protein
MHRGRLLMRKSSCRKANRCRHWRSTGSLREISSAKVLYDYDHKNDLGGDALDSGDGHHGPHVWVPSLPCWQLALPWLRH